MRGKSGCFQWDNGFITKQNNGEKIEKQQNPCRITSGSAGVFLSCMQHKGPGLRSAAL